MLLSGSGVRLDTGNMLFPDIFQKFISFIPDIHMAI
jgi:hypothetical protein